MTSLIVLLLLGIAFFVFATFAAKGNGTKNHSPLNQKLRPYVSKKPLTHTETIFYHRLVEALPDLIVLAQVQLSSFLEIDRSKTQGKNHHLWRNPISQQSIDFLICRKDFSIIVAIELDDKSHNNDSAIARDQKKNNNLEAAKVPLIRWHAEAMPEPDTIKRVVDRHTEKVDNTIAEQPEWLADEQAAFLKRRQKQNYSLGQLFVFAMLLIGASLWIMPSLINSFTKSITTQINIPQPLYRQPLQSQQASPSQEVLFRQQQERAAQEMVRARAQQALIQQQEQQKLMQAREDALKEDAWNHYYKKTVECTNADNMVKCGNTYIRNKQQFEYEWANQRYKFR